MKLKLDFDFEINSSSIQHGDTVILIGSCFSSEMAFNFENEGFRTISNPFGTIFHPIPIARLIQDSLLDNTENSLLQRKDLFFFVECWRYYFWIC